MCGLKFIITLDFGCKLWTSRHDGEAEERRSGFFFHSFHLSSVDSKNVCFLLHNQMRLWMQSPKLVRWWRRSSFFFHSFHPFSVDCSFASKNVCVFFDNQMRLWWNPKACGSKEELARAGERELEETQRADRSKGSVSAPCCLRNLKHQLLVKGRFRRVFFSHVSIFFSLFFPFEKGLKNLELWRTGRSGTF